MTIGSLTLSPVFDPEVLVYATGTSNNTNTITAVTDDPSAVIEIDIDGEPHVNGTAATWASGENIVTVTVTDGDSITEYVVTVTKT